MKASTFFMQAVQATCHGMLANYSHDLWGIWAGDLPRCEEARGWDLCCQRQAFCSYSHIACNILLPSRKSTPRR